MRNRQRRNRRTILALAAAIATVASATPALALAPVSSSATAPVAGGQGGSSLEAAASKAGDTGRKVAMSLIGLGFAVAAIVLSFRRDFKEAAGVIVIGIVAVLLATPSGLNLVRDTVSSLFGG